MIIRGPPAVPREAEVILAYRYQLYRPVLSLWMTKLATYGVGGVLLELINECPRN
jgi:hypothetical protein